MKPFSFFDTKQLHFYGAICGFILLFILFYLTFYFFGAFTSFPSPSNLIQWDAFWYNSIKEHGYAYNWHSASNSAFFPLFSYLWRILHVGAIGISLFNLLLFFLSLNILYWVFDIHIKFILLFMSLPAMMFFYVPYTESLFFLFCTIFLIGLKKNDLRYVFVGLFLASLTRGTAMFFVPAVIFMEVIASDNLFNKKLAMNVFVMTLASLLGLFIVVLIQYYQTYEWFAFAKQQNRFWLHKFDFPGFPLVSHGGDKSLWMDGFTFVIAVNCIAIGFAVVLRKFILKTKDLIFDNKSFLFTIGYLIMITIYSLFFNPKCYDAQTSLNSMNRYFFCNPFFLIFIVFIPQLFSFSVKNFTLFTVLLVIGFYCIGLNGDMLSFLRTEEHGLQITLLFFIALFIYLNLFYISLYNLFNSSIYWVIFTINTGLSAYCLHGFINAAYVG